MVMIVEIVWLLFAPQCGDEMVLEHKIGIQGGGIKRCAMRATCSFSVVYDFVVWEKVAAGVRYWTVGVRFGRGQLGGYVYQIFKVW